MTVTLLQGDCAEILGTLPPGSVDLTVTSPPYDSLRQYKGYAFDFERTARLLWYATKPGGVVVWVVNDQVRNGSETGTSFRQALYFMECGFRLHDTMIYKTPKMPVNDNRYQPGYEFMFVLSKGAPATFNPIEDKPNTQAGIFKKHGTQRNQDGTLKKMYRNKPTPECGRRLNVWDIDSGYMKTTKDCFAYDHPAMFPETLANDHILSWSNPGDTVLDPMMGSGTTGKMAVLNGRNFIGIEIAPEYMEIAKRRIEQAQAQPA
jgi:DNA modification methylase